MLFESKLYRGGGRLGLFEVDGVKIGCSICYDLRFPELYGALVERGAQILVMVAAMSKVHGAPHLEVLLRARAIETQAYVVAATQCGIYGSSDNELAGHSMVVDPWASSSASLGDEPGYLKPGARPRAHQGNKGSHAARESPRRPRALRRPERGGCLARKIP